jgi:hypothetical protein
MGLCHVYQNLPAIPDLPPPRKRPQNFSPSMEDLTHPYNKLGKAQSLKFRHSENELGDDDSDPGKMPQKSFLIVILTVILDIYFVII